MVTLKSEAFPCDDSLWHLHRHRHFHYRRRHFQLDSTGPVQDEGIYRKETVLQSLLAPPVSSYCRQKICSRKRCRRRHCLDHLQDIGLPTRIRLMARNQSIQYASGCKFPVLVPSQRPTRVGSPMPTKSKGQPIDERACRCASCE